MLLKAVDDLGSVSTLDRALLEPSLNVITLAVSPSISTVEDSPLESLWVTFPAACGVSPSHDQRRRQEAGLGLPEATREPPIGSLLKYPAACGGDPLFRWGIRARSVGVRPQVSNVPEETTKTASRLAASVASRR